MINKEKEKLNPAHLIGIPTLYQLWYCVPFSNKGVRCSILVILILIYPKLRTSTDSHPIQ